MADFIKEEEKVLERWRSEGINDKVRAKALGGKKFYFLDGPPYVTGDLHPGHIWVKTLKDIYVRYKRYRGFDVVDRAGYDVHGLPIENKLEKALGITDKKDIEQKVGLEKFISECKSYVEKYIGRIDADYERYGISLDFKNPYLPYTNQYIETAWLMFKEASSNGYLYKGKKTLVYCPHCETSLSQGSMEVEYKDVDDPSLFLAFRIDKERSKPKIKIDADAYLAVWTTTPWTLPANVAIAANPKELYVMIKVGQRNLILAKPRLQAFSEVLNESFTVVSEFYGSELDGIMYVSPLEEKVEKQKELRKYHRIILSDSFVSMEDGTGLVHVAPGHGIEDYQLGQKNRLPAFSPVGMDATYDEEGGSYKGIKIPYDANKAVLHDLESLGAVLSKGFIRHSYPHCWRCGNKLIFLATDQWLFNMQRLKNRLVKQNDRTSWHPDEVRGWEDSILTNTPDWCVSRQRYWGTPMPIWECKACSNYEVIGSLAELKSNAVNPGVVDGLTDLHRPHIDKVTLKCRKCGGDMSRVHDVLDVWWDSSVAFRASLTAEQFGSFLPTELIVEYVEQIRGWFQYMLKSSMMVYGKKPFKHIVVHGILFGPDGRKLSKSLGNYKPLNEMLKISTADAFRLWCSSFNPILNKTLNDLAIAEIKDTEKVISILHNVSNLLTEYEEMLGYKPEMRERLSPKGMETIDAWILSRLEHVSAEVAKSLDGYEAYNAATALKGFIIEDFSRFYIKIAKKRMIYGSRGQVKKIINIMDYILYRTLVLISPITPFVSEAVYLDRYARNDSIFLERWPKPRQKSFNDTLEADMEVAKETITALLNSREKAGITLRCPVLSATVELKDEASQLAVQRLSTIISDYINTKRLEVKIGQPANEEVKPLFAKLGPSFKDKAPSVAEALRRSSASELKAAVANGGKYQLHTGQGTFEISAEHFTISQKEDGSDAVPFKFGRAFVDTRINEELKEEALLREFERRIQLIRKEMKLKKADKIELCYEGAGELVQLLSKHSDKIKASMRAAKVSDSISSAGGAFNKDLDIDGELIKVSVKKLSA